MTQFEIILFLAIGFLALFGRSLWRRWRFWNLEKPEISRSEHMEMRVGLVILAMVLGLIVMKLLWSSP
jgi:hypothetical protein